MISFAAVFTAGLLTVLSPCVLPLAPIIVGGLVAADGASRWTRLRATLWFALGFAVVFVLLGLGVSALVTVVRPLRPVFLAVGAVTLVLYGLKMMGLMDTSRRFGWMDRSVGASAVVPRRSGSLQAMLLGVIFGLTWTPCAGPILGGVLTYVAAREGDLVPGAFMLLAYAAGVATPLVLVAAASEYVTPTFRRLGAHLGTIDRASGVALVALGVLVLLQIRSGADIAQRPGAAALETRAAVESSESFGVERLLFFHSEHCPSCRAMEAYLPALERACRSDRWTLSKIDVDRAENVRMLEQFNVRAVPTVSLLDEHGHEIVNLLGYQSEARLREALEHDVQVACAGVEPPSEPQAIEEPACNVGKVC